MKKDIRKTAKTHILILAVILVYITLLNAFKIYCPIRYLTNVPCPACGCSRALISLLHLDFKGYCYYNLMALPLCSAILVGVHINSFNKRYATIFLISVAFLTSFYYLYRLLFMLIP